MNFGTGNRDKFHGIRRFAAFALFVGSAIVAALAISHIAAMAGF